jgi:hypothetical protein
MVSDHLLASEVEGRRELAHAEAAPTGPLVYPESWQARIAELLAGGARVVDVPDPFAGDTELPRALFAKGNPLSQRFREDAALTAIALAIDEAIRPQLLMVLLPGIDRVSHLLWAGVEPLERYEPGLRPSGSEHAAMRAALEAYYAYTDALVGALAARFGPRDLVVVVSDHGFEAGNRLGFLTGVHESEAAAQGVLFARGPGVAAGAAAGEVAVEDLTPTLLAWLGLPAGADMDGRVAPFLDRRAPAPIPTWDAAPVERLPLAPSGGEQELVERLRDLGYVE